MTQANQLFWEKIFILVFIVVNTVLIAIPGIYTSEFKTFLDLSMFFLGQAGSFSPPVLLGLPLVLFVSSAVLAVSVLDKLIHKKNLRWEWVAYYLLSFMSTVGVLVLYGEYFRDAGLAAVASGYRTALGSAYITQLVLMLTFFAIQTIRTYTSKGEVVSGGVLVEDTAVLQDGERELYKTHAGVFFGGTGVLTLTSKRIMFFGSSIMTGSSLKLDIPLEDIAEVKDPRKSSWLVRGPALTLWVRENAGRKKITFESEYGNFGPPKSTELDSLFLFIHNLVTDEALKRKVREGEQVTVVEPLTQAKARSVRKYYWAYFVAFVIGIAIGGIIPMLLSLLLAHGVVLLLVKYTKD